MLTTSDYFIEEDESVINKKFLDLLNSGDLIHAFQMAFRILDFNIQDDEGNTPLILVAKHSKNNSFAPLFANFLLNKKSNSKIPNKRGETALKIACDNENLELIEQILNFSDDLENIDLSSFSPSNSLNITKILDNIRYKANNIPSSVYIDESEEENFDQILKSAIQERNHQKASAILEYMPSVSLELFEEALEFYAFDICKIMLDKGLNISSLLLKYSDNQEFQTFSNLLQLGADPNYKNSLNHVLDLKNNEMALELISYDAEIDFLTSEIVNELFVFSIKKHKTKAALSLMQHKNFSIKNEYLHLCINYNEKEVAVKLIENGVDVNFEHHGKAPYFLASQNKQTSIQELLVSSGAYSMEPLFSFEEGDDLKQSLSEAILECDFVRASNLVQKVDNFEISFDLIDSLLEPRMFSVLKQLVAKGVEINEITRYNRPLLHHYFIHKDFDKFFNLLQVETDPNIVDNTSNLNILDYVCRNCFYIDNLESNLFGSLLVKSLIEKGAKSNSLFLFNHGIAMQFMEHDMINTDIEEIIKINDEYLAIEAFEKVNKINFDIFSKIINNKWNLALEMIAQKDLDFCNENTTVFNLLLKNNFTKVARKIMDKNLNLDFIDDEEYSLLMRSIEASCDDISFSLIEKGSRTDYKYNDGSTLLMKALRNHLNETINILLEKGSNFDEVDDYGFSTLYYAYEGKVNENIINAIIEKTISIITVKSLIKQDLQDLAIKIIKNPKFNLQESDLVYAISKNEKEIALELIKKGINVNIKDSKGIPLVKVAFDNKLYDIARVIHDKLEDKNFLDPNDLLKAIDDKNTELAMKYIEFGVSLNVIPTKLIKHALRKSLYDLCRLMVDNGLDINALDAKGRPLLQYYAENNNMISFKDVLELQADPNIKTKNGVSILTFLLNSIIINQNSEQNINSDSSDSEDSDNDDQIADNSIYLDLILRLIEKGVNIDEIDENKLHMIFNRSIDMHLESIANRIIKHPNFKPQQFDLHYTIKNKMIEAAYTLINMNCNVDCKDAKGKTPLQYAMKNDEILIAMLLRSKGAKYEKISQSNSSSEDSDSLSSSDDEDEKIINDEPIQKSEEIQNENEKEAIIERNENQNDIIEEVKIEDKEKEESSDEVEYDTNSEITEPKNLYETIITRNKEKSKEFINDPDTLYRRDEDGRLLIYYALIHDMDEVCDELVAKGINLDSQDKIGKTLLQHFAEIGDFKRFCKLIEYGADLYCSRTSIPILSFVLKTNLENKCMKFVKKLVEIGVNVNCLDAQNKHALNYTKDINIMFYLINHGANMDIKNSDGEYVLLSVYDDNYKAICSRMIREYSHPCAQISETILIFAITHLHNLAMKMIPRCKISGKTYKGNNLLHIAILANDFEIAKIIVDKGIDLNAFNCNGKTALWLTIEKSNEEFAIYLIKKGAKLNTYASYSTSLLILALQKKLLNVVKELINAGASANEEIDGKTLLMESLLIDFDVAQKIIEFGVDINFQSSSFGTALDWAVRILKNQDIALFLINNISNVNTSIEGKSLLRESLENQLNNVTNAILSNQSFKPDPMDLIYAITHDYNETAKALIDLKVDLNAVDEENKSALIYAVEAENVEIGSLLISKGANIEYAMNYKPNNILINKKDIEESVYFDLEENSKVIMNLIKENKFNEACSLAKKANKLDHYITDEYGNTILILVADKLLKTTDFHESKLLEEIAKIYLEQKENIDAVNNSHATALMLAASSYSPVLLNILLQKGADISITDYSAKSLFDYIKVIDYFTIIASFYPQHPELIKQLNYDDFVDSNEDLVILEDYQPEQIEKDEQKIENKQEEIQIKNKEVEQIVEDKQETKIEEEQYKDLSEQEQLDLMNEIEELLQNN